MVTAALDRSTRLFLPFTGIGVAGAIRMADFFRAGCFAHDTSLRLLLLLFAPAAAAALGLALGSVVDRWPLSRVLLACAAGTITAGILAGLLIGTITWPPNGGAMGTTYGFLAGLFFFPAFGLVVTAAHGAGRARSGSVLDDSARGAVWRAFCAVIGAGTIAASPAWNAYPTCPPSASGVRVLGLTATAALFLLLLGEARRFAQAHAATAEAARMRTRDPNAPNPWRAGVAFIDFGIGETIYEHIEATSAIYRDATAPTRLIYGSPALARRALGISLLLGGMGLALAGGAVACEAFDLLGGRLPAAF